MQLPLQPSRALSFLWLLLAIPLMHAQTITVLHAFTSKGDGQYPSAGVLRDSEGNLYGVTYEGGAFGFGTIFEVNTSGKETVLHSFRGGDGAYPNSALICDEVGNLYGTTYGSIPNYGRCLFGCGTVFRLDRAGKLTVLYAFSGGSDGGNPTPTAGLIRDEEGNLYGTTNGGGDLGCTGSGYGCGVVFKLDQSGKETVLFAFNDYDGAQPAGGLIQDQAGNFYGVTAYGGKFFWGTVFKLDTAGKETILYSFSNKADGGIPSGTLVPDGKGNLYGTTQSGGTACLPGGCGTVFKLTKSNNESVVYSFPGGEYGVEPEGNLLRGTGGDLYGTTQLGGSGCFPGGCGIVFRVDTTGNETVLYRFTGKDDGMVPNGGLVMDKSGNLFGTTSYGGDLSCGINPYGGCGVVFKITP
jgi:uncharacterized repeat protein (TIGR03803 family)